MINPLCPHCQGKAHKSGQTKSGSQRYRCQVCDRSFNDSSNPAHRPLLGDRPLTKAEINQRYREKVKKNKE